MTYIYLASPYSHPSPEVREARYIAVRDATAWLLQRGFWTYSPIVHCHPMTVAGGLPTDAEFWREYNHAMIKECDMLYVLMIEGWESSAGVASEVKFAQMLGKRVVPWALGEAPAS